MSEMTSRLNFRLNDDVKDTIAYLMARYPKDYQSASHVIRAAVMKLKNVRLEEQKTNVCVNCGKVLNYNARYHQVGNNKICSACFMTSTAEDIKRWGVIYGE